MSLSNYNGNVAPARRGAGGNIVLGALIMLIGGWLLSFLPCVGALIVGVIGGKVAGSPSRGVLAALLPTIVIAALSLFSLTLFGGPIGLAHGVLISVSALLIALLNGVVLIIGALIGGAL